MNNLKQLSAALFRYANDHNGKMVPTVVYPSRQNTSAGWPWMTWLIDSGYLQEAGFDPEIAKIRPYPYDNLKRGLFTCRSRLTPGSAVYNKMHYGMNFTLGFPPRYNMGYKESDELPRLASIASPSTTLMLGETKYSYMLKAEDRYLKEGKDQNVEFPHHGFMNVIFFDGHAELSKGPWTLPVKGGNTYPWF